MKEYREREHRRKVAQYAAKIDLPCGHVWQDARQFPRRRIVRSEQRPQQLDCGHSVYVWVETLECGHKYEGHDAGSGAVKTRYCRHCPSKYAGEIAAYRAAQEQ